MLVQKQFQDIFTFTRSSSATRFNTSGVLETVGNNVPRLDYEPADVPVLGPELVTNGDFSNGTTGWTTRASSASVASGVVQITATATNYPGIEQTISGLVPGKIYVISGATRRGSCAAESALAVTGIGQSEVSNNSTAFKYSSTQFVATSTTHTIGPYIKSPSAIAGETFFSLGVSVKEIIGYTVRKGDPKGILIEEQRTNLLTYSEQADHASWSLSGVTVASNVVISPDGTLTADKLTKPATAYQNISKSVVTGAGTVYTASAFFKAGSFSKASIAFVSGTSDTRYWFDLAAGTVAGNAGIAGYVGSGIQPMGNGWYRCWVAVTAQAATGTAYFYPDRLDNAVAGDVHIWGMQLEAGSFPTSYIPTSGSQVTRAADNLSINTLSPWYNAAEGSVAITFDTIATVQPGIYPGLFTFEGASAADRIGAIMMPAQAITALRRKSGSADSYAGTTATVSPNSQIKFAQAWNSASQVSALNGAAASGTILWDGIPAGLSKMLIGRFDATLNGHIRRIRYFPKRLTDAQLQALTA